jgi:ankyrin repeat protein
MKGMAIRLLPPDEAAKKAKERVAEWKRQREIDGAKAKLENGGGTKDVKPVKKPKETGPDDNGYERSFSAADKDLRRYAHAGIWKGVVLALDSGANVNARGNNGLTPLHKLVQGRQCRVHIAALLIERGADVNAKDDMGRTALMIATEQGHTGIVELLKKHGATE